MAKLNIIEKKRVLIPLTDQLNELVDLYNQPNYAKLLSEIIVTHQEILLHNKKLIKRNKALENAKDVLISELRN